MMYYYNKWFRNLDADVDNAIREALDFLDVELEGRIVDDSEPSDVQEDVINAAIDAAIDALQEVTDWKVAVTERKGKEGRHND